jgi:hypothetical protein
MSRKSLQGIGRKLGNRLNREPESTPPPIADDRAAWWTLLEPGDVVLVETCSRIATAIKYITQSTWSHSALYVGDRCKQGALIEAVISEGVIASPVEKYQGFNVRICRPVGLKGSDLDEVLRFASERVGLEYDLRNIFDLARYLLPTPPVPGRWRRRLLTFGSGEPTKAICSSLIAEAFQQVRYPIIPIRTWTSENPEDRVVRYQIRHHGAFTPRDFDLSPFFEVVKPTLEAGFDYRALEWAD